jgi:hypothetical protein
MVPNLKRYYGTYMVDVVHCGVKNLTHTIQSSDTGLSFYYTLTSVNPMPNAQVCYFNNVWFMF